MKSAKYAAHRLGVRMLALVSFSLVSILVALMFTLPVRATPFTMTSPAGTVLPTPYPEAGGVVMILYGVNGNIYYQFSDPTGAFVGFQNSGRPTAFRGNPFTINDPLTMDCGVQSCSDYFGGAITSMEVRFTADDGDTQANGFDEDDISLLINDVNIGNWSDIPTQNTNNDGTVLISSQIGFGNRTFDTGWFTTSNAALLANILSTETISTKVFDNDPNDNYWNFSRGGRLSDPDFERVSPAYTLEKKAHTGSYTGAEITTFATEGEDIFYTYDVFNAGNVSIFDITVEDDIIGTINCTPQELLPGESATCQAPYVITQADFDAQEITNVAKVNGTPEFGQLGTLTDSVTLTGPGRNPSISITKTPDATNFGAVGTAFTYSFEIENTGDVTLTDVVATDPLIPSLSCTASPLAPAGTFTCTGDYTIQQTDVDAGFITNRVDVTSRDPADTIAADDDEVTNTPIFDPAFSVIKATSSFPTQVGDTLDYTFTLKNDGNIRISSPVVTDAKCQSAISLISGDSVGNGHLDVGETHVYSCTSFALTQTDIDAGKVDNDVSVTGTVIGGTLVPAVDDISTPIPANPEFSVVKSSADTPIMAGQTLTYNFEVSNDGNVSINTLQIADVKCDGAINLVSGDTGNDLILGSTETWNYSCTSIPVTQVEVDAGKVDNTVTLDGKDPSANDLPQAEDTLSIPITASPAWNITKDSASTPTTAGDTLDYTFDLVNQGNVTISSIALTDAKCAGAFTLNTGDTDGDRDLDVGETHQYTCTSVPVTQAEVDAGKVDNSVSVSGVPAGGTLPDDTAVKSVIITPTPALILDKKLSAQSPTSFDAVGQVLVFDFDVTNDGNVTITDAISITDTTLDGPADCTSFPVGGLAPGETMTCIGQVTIEQGDINTGNHTNTATATDGTTTSNSDVVVVNAVQNPSLALAKSAGAFDPSFSIGADVTYTYLIENDGNVTITDTIEVHDNRIDAPPVGGYTCSPVATTDLDPGDTMTCTAVYEVVDTDLDIGSITNIADATAGATQSPTDSVTVPANAEPALTLTKEATIPNPAAFTTAGDKITYTYTVQNTGGVAFIEPIIIHDNKFTNPYTCWTVGMTTQGGETSQVTPDPTFAIDANGTQLGGTNGDSVVCTQEYTVTQDDVDAGQVTNEATASSTFASVPVSSPPDVVTVDAIEDAQLSIVKTASPADLTTAAVGDTITYTFVITNDGSVNIDDVVPVDSGPTFNGVAATGSFNGFTVQAPAVDANTDGKADILAPTESATFEATYILTQNDIDAVASAVDPSVAIANTASATGAPRHGTLEPVIPSSATTGFTPEPAFTILKSTTSVPALAGDTLDYEFFVENNGNVTLSGVTVTDAKCVEAPALISGDLNANLLLDVGEIHKFTCVSIPVTQDEVDTGMVDNTAKVNGSDPAGNPVPEQEVMVSTPVASDGMLSVAKATTTVPTAAGETLDYTFLVTNDGNVSISDIVVSDAKCVATPELDMAGDADSDTALDPTEEWTYTCVSIPVTQDEVDAGTVNNTVTVDGKDPSDVSVPQAEDTLETPIASNADWSVEKTTVSTPSIEGDILDYNFAVSNDGNVSIRNIVVTDAKCATAPSLVSGSDVDGDLELDPTETWNYTCTSIPVTQAEIDAGSVDNTVTVAGVEPDGTVVPATDDTLETPVVPTPTWELEKTTSSAPTLAGETLDYVFDLVNTGNVSIDTISISDVKCAATPVLTAATDDNADLILSPSEEWQFTCTSIPVTQDEVDAGKVDNTATATGNPSGGTLDDADGSSSTAILSDPAYRVAKSTTSVPTAAGDVLNYTFVVENDGNVSVLNVVLADPKCAAAPTLDAGADIDGDNQLDPNETWSYSCTSIPVTQDEADAGTVDNTATLNGTDPSGTAIPETEITVETPLVSAAAWSVEKATASVPTKAGDILNYTFTVMNDGNVSISNIVVTDAKCSATPTLDGVDADGDLALDPTEVFTYSCDSIPVTQEEVDAGVIDNDVSLTGTEPNGDPMDVITDTLSTPVAPAPGIEAQKTITSSTVTVGESVTFEITLENTGNVTLTGVTLVDMLTRSDTAATPLTLTSGPSYRSADMGSSAGTLKPTETATYTASYVLTQEDIDAGGISNTATGTGTPPTGSPVSDVSDDGVDGNGDDNPVVLVVPIEPAFEMLKELAQVTKADGSTASSFDIAGDRIDYTFTVTNTGNVTLVDPIRITDPLITDAGGVITCEPVPLAPMARLECTASYVVQQSDVNAGKIDNSATATDGTITTDPSMVSVGAVQNPEMEIVKTAQDIPAVNFFVDAEVNYTYVVTNTGNVTITEPIIVTDNLIDAADMNCPIWPGELNPTETYTCSAVYTVTSNDVDLGATTNIADATDGTIVTAPDSETVPGGASPALSFVKSSPDTTFAIAGDILNYTFVVTNSGDAAYVRPIKVIDDRIGDITCWAPDGTTDPDFKPGEMATCAAQYVVTQDDLDAGSVTNNAYANTTYGGTTDVVSPPDSVTIPATVDPMLDLLKSVELPTGKTNDDLVAGDILTYTLTVENTGNQTLTNVTLSDPLIGLSCVLPTLAVQTSDASCFGTYTLTQDDINAGLVKNEADVMAADPLGATITDETELTTPMAPAAPMLELTKTATPDPFGVVGSTIVYAFAVENTGNVTMMNVVVNDPLDATYSCTISAIAPAATDNTCSMNYVVTQDDVDRGFLTNTATATGVSADPTGQTIEVSDTITTNGPVKEPSLEATKTLSSEGAEVGDIVTFTISVENTGNVTLDTVELDDQLTRSDGTSLALTTGPTGPMGDAAPTGFLGVDETWVYTATYRLVQNDINEGGIQNVVTATANDPDDNVVSDVADDGDDTDDNTQDDPTVFTIVPGAAIEAVKSIVDVTNTTAGGVVTFAVTVENKGNVDLSGIIVDDTLVRADGTATAVQPVVGTPTGDVSNTGILDTDEVWTYTFTYTLDQDDVDAGGIENVVTATGTAPSGEVVSDVSDDGDDGDGNTVDDPTMLDIPAEPGIEALKRVTTSAALANETMVYEITVMNTGTVTLTNVTAADTLTRADGAALSLTSGPTWVSSDLGTATEGSLLPAETATYTATYVLQQTDIDAGGISNSVLATGSTPSGASVSDISDDGDGFGTDDPTDTLFVPSPALTLEKTVAFNLPNKPSVDAGDLITYTYVVLNSGNVTAYDVAITETAASFSGTGALPVAILQTGGGDFDAQGDAFDVLPGETMTFTAEYALTQADIDNLGVENQAVGEGTDFGGAAVSDISDDPTQVGDDDPTVLAIAIQTPGDVTTTKSATPTDVRIGDTVTYTVTVELSPTGGSIVDGRIVDVLPAGIIFVPGSAVLAGVAQEPDAILSGGRRHVWPTAVITPGTSVTLIYQGRVSANAPTGNMVNTAWLESPREGGRLGNVASATVSRAPEHVFDCTDIIGKVFDDKNGNGYQDGATNKNGISEQEYDPSDKFGRIANSVTEPGLPGVRVVTVKGTVITTDKYGRYHIPCAETPGANGRNYILKVDERSLPTGYRLTTENPRVERLTAGKFAKMNFGASITSVVTININSKAFDGTQPKPAFVKALANAVHKMKNRPSVIRLNYAYDANTQKSKARAHLRAVNRIIKSEWRKKGQYKLNIEHSLLKRR